MHCQKTGLGALGAHPEPRSCAHWACSAHVVGTAARTASTGRAHAGRALVATRPGSLPPGRDLTSMSRHQGSQNHVATPPRPHHVVTSNRCRDTTQSTPCRDIKSVSRHRFSCPAQARSRHQDQVATFLETNPCRDINFMSRPRFCPQKQTRPRRHFLSRPLHVATSKLGRDLVLEIGSSHSSFCLAQIFFFFFFKLLQ